MDSIWIPVIITILLLCHYCFNRCTVTESQEVGADYVKVNGELIYKGPTDNISVINGVVIVPKSKRKQ